MKRRICSVLLALCMTTTLLPQTALAGEETTVVIQLPGDAAPAEGEESKLPDSSVSDRKDENKGSSSDGKDAKATGQNTDAASANNAQSNTDAAADKEQNDANAAVNNGQNNAGATTDNEQNDAGVPANNGQNNTGTTANNEQNDTSAPADNGRNDASADAAQGSNTANADSATDYKAQNIAPTAGAGEGTPVNNAASTTPAQDIQALIDALPDAAGITADQVAVVTAQLEAIDTAKGKLSEDELAALDFTRYDAVAAALLTLEGENASGVATTAVSGEVSDETGLRNALDDNSIAAITLTKDIDISDELTVARTVTLDLNGHVLKQTGNARVIKITGSGNLMLKDSNPKATHNDLPAGGVITGGDVGYGDGGGVFIDCGGSFTMHSGTIANCKARQGGGVYLDGDTFSATYASFTMLGGTITDCEAYAANDSTSGGGVFNLGNFIMKNGRISNCKVSAPASNYYSQQGGGIFNTHTLEISGSSVIENCNAQNYSALYSFRNYNGLIKIISGTFTGSVNLTGTSTISGGTFEDMVRISDSVTITGGTFQKPVTVDSSTIEGGIFYQGIIDRGAIIEPSAKRTLSFDTASSATVPSQTLLRGLKPTRPADDPSKPGYIFTDWYTADGQVFDFTRPLLETQTLTAKWQPKPYTLSFSDTSLGAKTVEWDSKVLDGIAAPTKDGYRFDGWKCGTSTVTASTTYSDLVPDDSVASVTLTPQWTDITAPVISGITDGATYCASQTVTVTEENLATVTVNGVPVTLDSNGQFILSPADGPQRIIARDTAGNSSEITVTVNNGHTGGTATCTKQAVCEVCGVSYGNKNPNNHTGSLVWKQTATTHQQLYSCCNAVAMSTADHTWKDGACTVCGYICQHTGGETTCTEAATCTYCGTLYGNPDLDNHTALTHVKAKKATKKAEGNIEYWYCKGCDTYYADADATKEITEKSTLLKKLDSSSKESEKKSRSVETGDNSQLMVWILLLALSAGVCTVLFIRRRKTTDR